MPVGARRGGGAQWSVGELVFVLYCVLLPAENPLQEDSREDSAPKLLASALGFWVPRVRLLSVHLKARTGSARTDFSKSTLNISQPNNVALQSRPDKQTTAVIVQTICTKEGKHKKSQTNRNENT